MSGKTVFDHLNEQIDGVVRGRRFIIAEIGKLKVTVEDLKDALGSSGSSDLGATISDLKSYMSEAVNTLSDLKNSVSQLVSSMTSMKSSVENTYNIVKGMKSGGGMPAMSSPSTSSMGTSPSFSAPTSSAPMGGAPTGGGDVFGPVITAATTGKTSKELGMAIDQIRTDLSKKNPLNPILFELSMEAGRLKSLGDKVLDAAGIQTLKDKIANWRAKSQ